MNDKENWAERVRKVGTATDIPRETHDAEPALDKSQAKVRLQAADDGVWCGRGAHLQASTTLGTIQQKS